MKPRLHVIVASTRPGRQGPKFGQWFSDFARAHGAFDVHLVDLAAFDLPVFDEAEHPMKQLYAHEHTRRWAESVDAADAFVFVMPEYDYFPPSSLVNALAFLSREWSYKPAGFVSYGGVSGGLRAVQAVKPLVTTLKMMPLPEGVAIPNYWTLFDETGAFRSNELIDDGARTMLDELARWTGALAALRPGREAQRAA